MSAALPAAAEAGSVSTSGSYLTFTAAAGEPNALTVERLSTGFRVTDSGAPLTAGAGCTQVHGHAATCALGSVSFVKATLGAGSDSARVIGSAAALLYGGPGTDVLTGSSRRDTLDAGTGNGDRLTGGAGGDRLIADQATSGVTLTGGADDDTLVANPSASHDLFGYGGYFRLDGGAGNDTIEGSSGLDTIDGGTGADTIRGGDGYDVVTYESRTEALTVDVTDGAAADGGASDAGTVNGTARRDDVSGVESLIGGSGDDALTTGGGNDTLRGGGGNDHLHGGGGNDYLCGDTVGASGGNSSCYSPTRPPAGDDVLDGGAGNDHLEGQEGSDRLDGGEGRDLATWQGRTTGIVATIEDRCGTAVCAAANDGAVDTDPSATGNQGEGDTVGLDVESLLGGDGDDTLTGTAGNNDLGGNRGADVLHGRNGDDFLCGDGPRYVQSAPLACQDMSYTDMPGGRDTLNGGEGDDLLGGGEAADTFAGGSGEDTVTYQGDGGYGNRIVTIADRCSSNGVSAPCALANDGLVDAAPRTEGNQPEGDKVGLDIENLIGGGGGDTLGGSVAANLLDGGSGSDTLNGGDGNDLLVPGYDGYSFGANTVSGGGGFDYVSYRFHHTGVAVSLDNVANDGQNGATDNVRTDVDGILGSEYDDVLTGNPAASTAEALLGYGGKDTLDGNGGADALTGGDGVDSLFGDGGNDVLDSADGAADTTVDCAAGTDRVIFDSGMDTPAGCETRSTAAAR